MGDRGENKTPFYSKKKKTIMKRPSFLMAAYCPTFSSLSLLCSPPRADQPCSLRVTWTPPFAAFRSEGGLLVAMAMSSVGGGAGLQPHTCVHVDEHLARGAIWRKNGARAIKLVHTVLGLPSPVFCQLFPFKVDPQLFKMVHLLLPRLTQQILGRGFHTLHQTFLQQCDSHGGDSSIQHLSLLFALSTAEKNEGPQV